MVLHGVRLGFRETSWYVATAREADDVSSLDDP